jgi:hypothetical protein
MSNYVADFIDEDCVDNCEVCNYNQEGESNE